MIPLLHTPGASFCWNRPLFDASMALAKVILFENDHSELVLPAGHFFSTMRGILPVPRTSSMVPSMTVIFTLSSTTPGQSNITKYESLFSLMAVSIKNWGVCGATCVDMGGGDIMRVYDDGGDDGAVVFDW